MSGTAGASNEKSEQMYSYVIEFNLAQRGEEAQEFLAEAARTWPKVWGDIPGVTGVLLLSSAFALGGDYDYQLRVDLESLSTLARVDEALKSDSDQAWVRARTEWFRSRIAARAHLSEHVAGDESYAHARHSEAGGVHLVLHGGIGESGRATERIASANSISGLVSAQTLRSVVGTAAPREHTWLRLQSLEHLDGVADAGLDVTHGHLLGELREVDGALFSGA
ncbi:MAG TPA: hypothetical protein VFU36_07645 [Jatrophihabitans sp.]|nr:hypothetical protein [Jatrophihabitans sp.]